LEIWGSFSCVFWNFLDIPGKSGCFLGYFFDFFGQDIVTTDWADFVELSREGTKKAQGKIRNSKQIQITKMQNSKLF